MLTGPEIAAQVKAGNIVISGFDPSKVGANSYDLRIDKELVVYAKAYPLHLWWERFRWWNPLTWLKPRVKPLDPKVQEKIASLDIPEEGAILYPGVLYLGSTVEYTETHEFVPWIDGRSSMGRLGFGVHVTAGLGDDGFVGQWVLEITVVHPTIVYPGTKVCQICYDPVVGERKPYNGRYVGQMGPVSSRLYRDQEKTARSD